MAIGPTLGTGLFLAGGQALAVGGPASLLVSYIFLSLLVYFMATSVAEVATYKPSRHGTVVMHGFQYMNNSLGFATACLRWYTMAMFVPYEITTAMVNLGLWNPGSNIAVWLMLCTGIIVAETVFYRIKIGTLACLLALSLSIALGGATGHDHWGFQYWKKPGAMHEYLAHGSVGKFLGLLQSVHLSTAAFTFAPELIVQRAEQREVDEKPEISESLQPAANSSIPRRVFGDICQTVVPYILTSLAMGIMAPYNNPLLNNGGAGAGLSPFVIGINTARIRILPVTATLAILLSSVTSAQSFLYLASRSLSALADAGHAPTMFKNRNNWGVPWVAVVFTATFTTLALLSVATSSSTITTYFILFVNSSGYLSWILSSVVYRRFRVRLHANRITTAYRHAFQPVGTAMGFGFSVVLLLSNGLISAVPGNHNGPRGARVVMAYISIPLFGLLYVIHRFGDTVPRGIPAEECNVKEPPRAPEINHCPRTRIPYGRSLQPPTTLELDQVWAMAREV
ncbi:Amino acid/polyamine transporter I [Penicillium verhagenii]|nr:Amino acid/polyamine transporter I [Penicillium verhagenii]